MYFLKINISTPMCPHGIINGIPFPVKLCGKINTNTCNSPLFDLPMDSDWQQYRYYTRKLEKSSK